MSDSNLSGANLHSRIGKMSSELATALRPESITSPMSLYKIEREMMELAQLYRETIEDGDETAAVAIQAQLQKYVAQEVQKVDNCAGFIRFALDMAEKIKAEEQRLAKARSSWERIATSVKSMVLGVMQVTNQKKLQGRFSRFWVQRNSQDTVVIDDAAKVPEAFLMVTIKMPLPLWKSMLAMCAHAIDRIKTEDSALQGPPEISLSRIKAAIETGQSCPAGCHQGTTGDGATCSRCEGKGHVPTIISGAHLERGEHLRVE